eukprot:Opistho-1_new@20696
MRQGLTSAAGCRRILPGPPGDRERREVFAYGRVDADGRIKVGLGRAEPHAEGPSLRDLASVGRQHMEADDALLIGAVADELHVARVVLAVGHRPLEGLESHVVCLNVVLPVALDGVLFREPNAAVLERREDGRRNLVVVCEDRASPKHAVGKQLAGLDGHGRQLGAAEEHVANRVNVGHVRALPGVRRDLAGRGVDDHTGLVEVQLLRQRVPSDGEDDRVKDVRLVLARRALPGDPHARRTVLLNLLKLGGNGTPDELGLVVLHVLGDALGHILVEAAQENGARHDGRVVTQRSEEPRALERDVRSADDERLARRVVEREDVVAGDAALLVARNVGVLGTATDGDDNVGGGDRARLAVLERREDGVGIREDAEPVDVLDLLVAEGHAVAPVERANVVLDALHHRRPRVLHGLLFDFPSVSPMYSALI